MIAYADVVDEPGEAACARYQSLSGLPCSRSNRVIQAGLHKLEHILECFSLPCSERWNGGEGEISSSVLRGPQATSLERLARTESLGLRMSLP